MSFADRARRALPLSLLCLAGASLLAGVLALAPPQVAADPGPGTPNQPWPATCDVDVGLVVDRSNSIKRGDPANPDLVRAAARGMADRLVGTGARVALWSFGTMASGYEGTNPWAPSRTLGPDDYPSVGFTALDQDGDADPIRDAVDRIPFVTGAAVDPDDPDTNGAGSTNWEAALGRDTHLGPGAVAPDGSRPGDADVLVFFTDGNPTVGSSTSEPDRPLPESSDADVDDGVAAADALKAGGTRVVAVGAGLGDGIGVANLQRVSGGHPGAAEGDDYFLTDLEGLDDVLFEISTRFCGGTLLVRKLVPGAEVDTWEPEPGWRFETTFPDGTPAFVRPAAGGHDTDADGTVAYRWISAASGTRVRVAEQLAAGQALHHASCAAAGEQAEAFTTTELEVTVPQNGVVLCELYNYRPAVALELHKQATPTSVPSGGGEVTYRLEVHNPSTVDRVRLDALVDDRLGDLFAPGDAVVSATCAALAGQVLEPQATVACEVVAHVVADEGDHVNVATVTGTEVRPDGSDGEVVDASDDAVVAGTPAPDVGVSKDDGRTEVAPGERLTYTITATNHGTAPAPEVLLTDELPAGVELLAASDDAEVDGRAIRWPSFPLAVGESVQRTVTVRVQADAQHGDQVRNVARVAVDGDANPDDDEAVDDDVVVTEAAAEAGVPDERAPEDRPAPRRSGWLPRTGSTVWGWVLIALGLVSLGAAALLVVRLRPPVDPDEVEAAPAA